MINAHVRFVYNVASVDGGVCVDCRKNAIQMQHFTEESL